MKHDFTALIAMLTICTSTIILTVGCDSGRPTRLPKTYACTIVVKNADKPIDSAVVTLVPSNHGGDWASGGITDASGIAQMKTTCASYQEKGVPEGEYTIIIARRPDIEGDKTQEEIDAMPGQERDAYFADLENKRSKLPPVVPPEWGNSAKTPLKITVGTKDNRLELDTNQKY